MNREQSVYDILARWEDAVQSGQAVSLETLCAARPELLEEVKQKISILNAMDRKFGSVAEPAGQLPACPLHETSHDDDTDPDNLAAPPTSSWCDAKISLGSQFSVQEAFNRGGLGEIFHAYDETVGRKIALKVMRAPLENDALRRQRFMREAIITGRLEHPGIAPVYAVGHDSAGRLCYAMRFIEGETLRQAADKLRLLRSTGQSQAAALELRRLLASFISVCNTIAYAHSHNIVHRDIKPMNIVLGSFGETFVLDWGLAKILSQADSPGPAATDQADEDAQVSAHANAYDDDLTMEGMVVGTPIYMSPEQSKSLTDVGVSSDIYSLGATLFFVLTGQPPLQEQRWEKLLERVRTGQLDRPRDIVPDINRALEAICLKALALNPADRYPSALELAGDLERYLADQAVTAFDENLWQRLLRLSRRHRVVTQAAAVFLVAFSIITTLFAVATNYERNRAQAARTHAEQLVEQTRLLAEQEARAKSTAEAQSALALETLRSVLLDIQRKLSNVSGGVEARRSMLQTALRGLAKVADSLKNRTDVDRNLVIAFNEIGGIYLTAGQSTGEDATKEAIDCFQQSLQLAQQLAIEDNSDAAQQDISICFEKLGEAYWQLGQVDEAEKAYRQSFEITKSLNSAGRFNRDLAFGYEKLGDIFLEKAQHTDALSAYQSSRDYFQADMDLYPDNLGLKRDLIVSLSKLGSAHLKVDSRAAAAQAYMQAIEQQRSMIGQPDSPVSKRDLSVMLNKLGVLEQEDQHFEQAEKLFTESLQLAREYLVDEPNNVQRKRDVTISLNNLGDLLLAAGQLEQSQMYFTESLEIRRQTFLANPESQPAKIDFAYVLERLADAEMHAGQSESATERLRQALELLQPLSDKKLLQTAFSQELHATILSKLGK